jgi:hypothetical protein
MGCKYRRERKDVHGQASSLIIIRFAAELNDARFDEVKRILSSDHRIGDIHYRGKKVSFVAAGNADVDFLIEVLESNGLKIEE